MRTKVLAIVAVTGLVVAFQNCGKVRNSAVPDSSSSSSSSAGSGSGSSADANVLSNATGQSLTFLSINKEQLGSISAITNANNQLTFPIKNPVTGRKAIVVVDLDPVTKKFKAVSSASAPYMCYDIAQNPCAQVTIPAGFANAGNAAVNCGSPIFFTGALNGSVNNITVENYSNCGF